MGVGKLAELRNREKNFEISVAKSTIAEFVDIRIRLSELFDYISIINFCSIFDLRY